MFDPTVLRNGVHEIRLYAQDLSGNVTVAEGCAIVDGGLKTGQVNMAFEDISLPRQGFPLSLAREYDSRAQGPGDFGPGWNLPSKNVKADVTSSFGRILVPGRSCGRMGHTHLSDDRRPAPLCGNPAERYGNSCPRNSAKLIYCPRNSRTVRYEYDNLNRLTQEEIVDPANGDVTISYTYDDFGNRLTKTDSSGTVTYSYDDNDRLVTEAGNGFSVTYTYDDNGCTLSKDDGVSVVTYGYDYENRLVFAETPLSQTEYVYDDDGIRVRSSTGGVITNYLADKNRDYAQVLEETDAGGSLTVSYIYGDDLISQNRGGAEHFYHYDGLGSTRALTDDTADVTDTYIYEAFGDFLSSTGTADNNYLFTGEQYDANAGFYYLRARYYDQGVGRFLTTDPWQGNVLNPISLHKYAYANNNPIIYTDPSGYFSLIEMSAANSIRNMLTQQQIDAGLGLMNPNSEDEVGVKDAIIVFGGLFAAKIALKLWKAVVNVQRAKRLVLLKKVRVALRSNERGVRLEGRVARRFYKELVDFQKNTPNTEIDVELKNVIIEVASGGGKGKTKQIRELLNVARSKNKILLVYGPTLGKHVSIGIRKLGVNIYRNLDDLEVAVRMGL